MGNDLKLSISLADYHRTRPLLDGHVKFRGIAPDYHTAAIGEACLVPVYEQFDVAEMSLSWYAMARSRGEPVFALPVFPLRMFVHSYVFCRADSGITKPEDLRGRRVGMDLYRLTVGLWTRGIFEEHHGVTPDQIHWFTSDAEGAGFEPPANVEITRTGRDMDELLVNGDIDAVIAPNVIDSFRSGDPRVRRMYSDIRGTIGNYFDTTGIFPTTHTLVAREDLLRREPWIVDSLVEGFESAETYCRKQYEYPKRVMFPTSVLIREEEEKRFGANPWRHGLEGNEHTLDRFMEYAFRQGYTGRRMSLAESFWPVRGKAPPAKAAPELVAAK